MKNSSVQATIFTWIFASRRRTLSASIWEWTLKIHFAFVTTVICGDSLCVWGEATLENYVFFNISCLQFSMIKFVVLFALCFVLFKGSLSLPTAGRKNTCESSSFPSNSFRFSARTGGCLSWGWMVASWVSKWFYLQSSARSTLSSRESS